MANQPTPRRGRPPLDNPMVKVNFRIDPDLAERIERYRKAHKLRSVSEVFRLAVGRLLDAKGTK